MKHELDLQAYQLEVFNKIEKRKDPYPICVELHPTDLCNQGCEYCFHGGNGFDSSREPDKYFNSEEYGVLMNELPKLGVKYVSVSGGGDPFLSKATPNLIELAVLNGVNVRIVTHGNFLPAKSLEDLAMCEEIRFSIDTPNQSTYSQVRHVAPQMHERTLDNIKQLLQARQRVNGRVNIGATFIIGEINKLQAYEFAQLMLGEIGIDTVIYKYDIYDQFKVSEENDLLLTQQLESAQRDFGSRVEIRPYLGKYKGGNPCVVPFFKSVINPYGQLFSCCLGAQPGEKNGYYFGNVLEEIRNGNSESFTTIWESSRNTRVKMLEDTKCESCNHTDREINESYLNRR